MSRVYIGRLPTRCQERDVERFFREYGKIREIVLKNGYGFVEFDHYKDAEEAVYELNGRELRGERVIIEHAKLPPGRDSRGGGGGYGGYGYSGGRGRRESRYGPPTRTEYRVIVENLSSRISWQDLKDTMRKAGEVCYADAHRSNRNEGIVEFRSRDDMKAAIERYDGYELNGRKLKVYEDRGKKRRSSSRSSRSPRRRSRRSGSSRSSRGRSRSRSEKRTHRSRSDRKSRSRSGSRSPSRNRRSATRSRSRSVSKRSASHSPVKRESSRSPARDHSRSRSRSRSASERSRSRSGSPRNNKGSRSRSPSRSRSQSRASDRD